MLWQHMWLTETHTRTLSHFKYECKYGYNSFSDLSMSMSLKEHECSSNLLQSDVMPTIAFVPQSVAFLSIECIFMGGSLCKCLW